MARIVPAPPVPVCCPAPARPPPAQTGKGRAVPSGMEGVGGRRAVGRVWGVLCPEPNWGGRRVAGWREREREVTVPA